MNWDIYLSIYLSLLIALVTGFTGRAVARSPLAFLVIHELGYKIYCYGYRYTMKRQFLITIRADLHMSLFKLHSVIHRSFIIQIIGRVSIYEVNLYIDTAYHEICCDINFIRKFIKIIFFRLFKITEGK
jgi:hypothetical protein